MLVSRLVLGPLETNCWVVSRDSAGASIVIDPAGEASRIIEIVGERGIGAVVLTHGHFDHLGAVGELLEVSGAPLIVHEADAASITSALANGGLAFGFDIAAPEPSRIVRDGDIVEAGGLSAEVLHTPGHTPGSICLLAEGHLFAGDTLFAGSVGRADLPGGDARALLHSIAEKLVPLDDGTIVHPGHGPDTTIGRERRLNPFFPRARST